MFDITTEDLIAVFESLKDKYPLVFTNTADLNEGFDGDFPIIVGKAHGQIIELYEYGGDFVLDVMDEAHTMGTHWHPNNVNNAIVDITEFMQGKCDYKLSPFKNC